jgi:hypothetical protein
MPAWLFYWRVIAKPNNPILGERTPKCTPVEKIADSISRRTFEGGGSGIKTFGPLAGHSLLRTQDRAQRI